MDGDVAGGGIGDHLRDDKRADPRRSALQIAGVLLFELIEAANAAAEDHTEAIEVFAFEIETAILQSGHGGDQGKLSEAIEPAGGLGVQVLFGLEVLDLPSDMD